MSEFQLNKSENSKIHSKSWAWLTPTLIGTYTMHSSRLGVMQIRPWSLYLMARSKNSHCAKTLLALNRSRSKPSLNIDEQRGIHLPLINLLSLATKVTSILVSHPPEWEREPRINSRWVMPDIISRKRRKSLFRPMNDTETSPCRRGWRTSATVSTRFGDRELIWWRN